MKNLSPLILLLVVAAPAWAQTTINTDGDVEAQGFIGDGSQVTEVNAQLLDGMDSADFAQEMDLQTVERALVAILAQFPELGKVPLTRTGQSTCYDAMGVVTTCGTGIGLAQDGDLQLGVSWPNPRFTINQIPNGTPDGTVTDNLTGLVWLRDANCFGTLNWADALAASAALQSGDVCPNTTMFLVDGSVAGEWRLPNLRELQSLVHYGVFNPAVPDTSGTGPWSEGDPFSGVQTVFYWSSTSVAESAEVAWIVGMGDGHVACNGKDFSSRVWPVRGGQ